MCMKGLKGSNYGPVIKWYKSMEDNSNLLVDLIEFEQDKNGNALGNTMNIIKVGLFSYNLDLANYATKLISKIRNTVLFRAS